MNGQKWPTVEETEAVWNHNKTLRLDTFNDLIIPEWAGPLPGDFLPRDHVMILSFFCGVFAADLLAEVRHMVSYEELSSELLMLQMMTNDDRFGQARNAIWEHDLVDDNEVWRRRPERPSDAMAEKAYGILRMEFDRYTAAGADAMTAARMTTALLGVRGRSFRAAYERTLRIVRGDAEAEPD
ncbi:hypothetical protein [Alsobacter sp. R-9]